ncbi:protein G3 [Common bottlenose dolphin gammaherpesvirus 1 strain Sarasota]|uniref:Protein G3 n=1 Tax=Common bottlenose dolphin gammaherpesvirus 1 strain Sarasota TaxID=2022783 RepID=A0A1Z1NE64_9GAMA|nr:protein G3 [Common bottlenose dolphin gammaherpesvirus 1 strain Sarasota]ARW78071.1 protein G3 [Common bottlenose dolphin gammaherpesvirus 1 strain Sarasota]
MAGIFAAIPDMSLPASNSDDGVKTIYYFRKNNEFTGQEEALVQLFRADGRMAITSKDVTLETGYFVTVKMKDAASPEEERAKIIMLRALRRIMRGLEDEPLMTRSSILEYASQSWVLLYGPPLDAPQTAFSGDFRQLLYNMPWFNSDRHREAMCVYRVEPFRMLAFRPNLATPSEAHLEAAAAVLNICPQKWELYPLGDGGLPSVTPEALHLLVARHPKCDMVWKHMMGFGSSRGCRGEYNLLDDSLHPEMMFDETSKRVLFVVKEMDEWSIHAGLGQESTITGEFRRSFGFVQMYGEIGSCVPESQVLRNQLMAMYATSPLGAFLGITDYIPGLGPIEEGGDRAALQHKEEMLLKEKLEAQLTAYRCAGLPTTAGFLRMYPDGFLPTDIRSLITYQHVVSMDLHGKLHETPNGDPGTGVVYYELGEFSQISPGTHSRELYYDSGRQAGAIVNAVQLFLSRCHSGDVVGVSEEGLSNTMLAKISSLAHSGGFAMWSSSLPRHVQAGLRRFSAKNAKRNASVVKDMYLHVHTPTVVVALIRGRHTGAEVSPDILLKTSALACGCLVREIGWGICEHKFVVFDDRVNADGSSGHSLTLDLLNPKYPLSVDPMYAYANAPLRMPWDDMEASYTLMGLLEHPTVGSKEFIIRHSDRCSSGRVAQQQGVGPVDTPVSDYSILVTATCKHVGRFPDLWDADQIPESSRMYSESHAPGVCSAVGENATLTTMSPNKGVLFAITEALLNLIMSPVQQLNDVRLSAAITWPQEKGFQGNLAIMLDACLAFCRELGTSFEVISCNASNLPLEGSEPNEDLRAVVITSLAPCSDVTQKITPDLKKKGSVLVYTSLLNGEEHHCGSILQQAVGIFSGSIPVLHPKELKKLWNTVVELKNRNLILSGHDVSDGGLWACVAEMAMAGDRSAVITVPTSRNPVQYLASETPGLVLEVPKHKTDEVMFALNSFHLYCQILGEVGGRPAQPDITVVHNSEVVLRKTLTEVRSCWRAFSDKQNLVLAGEPLPERDYGNNSAVLTSEPYCFYSDVGASHYVTVLMMPGCTRPHGLLAALADAGFVPVLLGVNACDYALVDNPNTMGVCVVGDCNFANTEVGNREVAYYMNTLPHAAKEIRRILSRPYTFSLGIGSLGCEILSQARAVGFDAKTGNCLTYKKNVSGKYESRWLNVFIPHNTKALAFRDLRGSLIPCWAQGTHLGFQHASDEMFDKMYNGGEVASFYYGRTLDDGPAFDYPRNPAEAYPAAGVCSSDGRHLVLMHDPSISSNLWQWPYIPHMANRRPLRVSPWKTMFYSLHRWSLSVIDRMPL